jgi:[ribosomal protein S18]-alanine N-acetyltransferase
MSARKGTVVRTAKIRDIAELVRIEQTCFDGDRLTRRSFMRLIRRGSAAVFVAVIAGRVCAYAIALFRRNSRVARVYSIAVDPRCVGAGLGRRLMTAVEKEGRIRNCNRVQLEVRSNNARAISLYERLGFLRFETCEGYYADGCDAHRYVKRLTSTSLPVETSS